MSVLIDDEWAAGNHVFYIYWARSYSGPQHREGMYISSFRHLENEGGLTSRGEFASETVVWHDTDGFSSGVGWHYGGQLSFGPDSRIYLSLGDKYSELYQRSPKYNAGCVIRMNKNGTVPEGNLPSYVKPSGCWAYGVRNGFRSTWDLGDPGDPDPHPRYLIGETGGNDNLKSHEVTATRILPLV